MATRLVTFLSDFGHADSYVAEVKAVLLASKKPLQIVDLTHEVPVFDIEWGAFQLFRSYRYFPEGTIHLGIVDPGVGTSRRAIYVKTKRHHFIGPDNGLLKWAAEDAVERDGGHMKIFEIQTPSGTLPTFHGRDVFAPFAARLIRGKKAKTKAISELAGRSFPKVKLDDGALKGEILGFDRYGNAITNILAEGTSGELILDANAEGGEAFKVAPNYQAILPKQYRAIHGSHGFWEIAGSETSAKDDLKLKSGASVFFDRKRSS